MKRYIAWGVGVVLIGVVVSLGFFLTNPKPVTESVSDAAKNIFFDAKWYEVLWMRWTAVDWVLSLLAAGTAIAAAVQNAFSNHAQARAQAAAQGLPLRSIGPLPLTPICALLVTQSYHRINPHGFTRGEPASRNRDRSQHSCQTGKRSRIGCTYAIEQPRHQAGKSKCGP
jgi:hypothetical protein